MRVGPTFFLEPFRVWIPNVSSKENRDKFPRLPPKFGSSLGNSPNKDIKIQNKEFIPPLGNQKFEPLRFQDKTDLPHSDSLNSHSIQKWLNQTEEKSTGANRNLWDYLFPGIVYPRESAFIRRDSRRASFLGLHNNKGQVFFSFLYSSMDLGEMGFLFQTDPKGEESMEIIGFFGNESSQEKFIQDWQNTPKDFLAKLQTKVFTEDPPNGNYR